MDCDSSDMSTIIHGFELGVKSNLNREEGGGNAPRRSPCPKGSNLVCALHGTFHSPYGQCFPEELNLVLGCFKPLCLPNYT